MASPSPIEHVFVIMLENRSFDNMLGLAGIEGVPPPPITEYSNTYKGNSYPVTGGAPTSMTSDPGHELLDVLQQLTNLAPSSFPPQLGPYPSNKIVHPDFPNGTGFVANYATVADEEIPPPTAPHYGDIMKCFTAEQIPILSQLAKEFAVCTRWHCSIPGPTWPNRFFVHLASSNGLDCSPTLDQMSSWMTKGFSSPNGSIFEKMEGMEFPPKHKIYHDYDPNTFNSAFSDDPERGGGFKGMGWIPQVGCIKGIKYEDILFPLKEYFEADINRYYPYAYTFIEPHYGEGRLNTYYGGSSQHPMDDVYGGEALVKFVYEKLRQSPIWEKSLLIITYDEHGGFYDSVAPPGAPPPNDGSIPWGVSGTNNKFGFEFDQYGVRVPAIVISPWIQKNTVENTELYDHTSVLKTLEEIFNIPTLTDRDSRAKSVLNLLNLDSPRTDCPTDLGPLPPSSGPRLEFSEAEIEAMDQEPLPESGNLIGSMGILVKMDYEMSLKTQESESLLRTKIQNIKTRGQLKAYAAEVAEKLAGK
ncbi:MAG: alkaline phosphatase family protein [Saprospiraceae bacterium]